MTYHSTTGCYSTGKNTVLEVLYHPYENDCLACRLVQLAGQALGKDFHWIHCSLKISLPHDFGSEYGWDTTIHEFTDSGVISYNELERETEGITRIVLNDDLQGLMYAYSVIERIEQVANSGQRLHWFDAVPVLLGMQPNHMVCTTFIQYVLGLHEQRYLTPSGLEQYLMECTELNNVVNYRQGILWI